MAEYKKIIVGELGVNCYIVYSGSSKKCFVLDPGDESGRIIDIINDMKLIPEVVILTHAHMDHCGGVSGILNEFNVPLLMHKEDLPVLRSKINMEIAASLGLSIPTAPDRYFSKGEKIEGIGIELEVVHTPGHTPGSVCLGTDNLLFTGDTLFAGSVGRTDLPGGDFGILQNSLDVLKNFPSDTIILPGHGDSTTLEKEMVYNPFMQARSFHGQ